MVLVVEGKIDIHQAADLHTLLLERAQKLESLTLNIMDLEEVDPAVLQIFLSLGKTLESLGKTLRFQPDRFPSKVQALITLLGLEEHLGGTSAPVGTTAGESE